VFSIYLNISQSGVQLANTFGYIRCNWAGRLNISVLVLKRHIQPRERHVVDLETVVDTTCETDSPYCARDRVESHRHSRCTGHGRIMNALPCVWDTDYSAHVNN